MDCEFFKVATQNGMHPGRTTPICPSHVVNPAPDAAGTAIPVRFRAALTLVPTRITTSDERGWDIQSDPTEGWITGVILDGGTGKRSFTYNTAGLVPQVKDAADSVMYEFAYVNDDWGRPTVLTEERHHVDVDPPAPPALRTVVQHEIVSDSLRYRKEFTAPGEFRRFDFAYDTANGLDHRLASITSHDGANGTGTAFTTTFTHDVENLDGSMVITQVMLPDGTTIDHEYDSHEEDLEVNFGFRTKSTRTGPSDGLLVTFDVDYEFFYTQGGTRLYYRPRIVRQRDGRGATSEVTFDYDNGGQYVDGNTQLRGQDLNRLLSITGPTINPGPPDERLPQTRFVYGSYYTTNYWLHSVEVVYDGSNSRDVEFERDELLRVTSRTVDPGGEDIVIRFSHCDTLPTQDLITVDPDGDVDDADFANFQACFGSFDATCLALHDFDADGQSDTDIDLGDFSGFYECFNGPNASPGSECPIISRGEIGDGNRGIGGSHLFLDGLAAIG